MRDDLRSPDDGPWDRAPRPVDGERAVADREVPIAGTRRNLEFWNSFEEAVSARREVRAPAGFAARVMAAILMELPG